MPVMNGVEATRIIRTQLPESKRAIGIIAMTANVLQEDVKHYLESRHERLYFKAFSDG